MAGLFYLGFGSILADGNSKDIEDFLRLRSPLSIIPKVIDPEFLFPPKMNKNYVTVEEAIFDLPFTKSGQGEFKSKYDKKPITDYQKKMRRNAKSLYNHISTKHDDRVLKIMKMLLNIREKMEACQLKLEEVAGQCFIKEEP